MNQHTNPQSISERADHLEEEMMHELERVITKSTLHYLADGEPWDRTCHLPLMPMRGATEISALSAAHRASHQSDYVVI